MTDYTTLQYHLANKTHIEFIIKLVSGIIGIILNVVLIPKMGLKGVGIATFAANFLYWLLSVIIIIPNLNLEFPKNTVLRILLTAIPTGVILYLLKLYGGKYFWNNSNLFTLSVFYLVYFWELKKYKTYIVIKLNIIFCTSNFQKSHTL